MKRSSTYSGFVSTDVAVQEVQVKNEVPSLHKYFFLSPYFFFQLMNTTEGNLAYSGKTQI